MVPIIIGGSVEGYSHKTRVDSDGKSIGCQDSYLIIDGKHKHDRTNSYYAKIPEGVKIVSVADGHGSASCPYSKNGSSIATNVFCDIMAETVVKYQNQEEELFRFLNSEGDATHIAKTIIMEWETRVLKYHKMMGREIILRETGETDDGAIYKKYGTTLLGMLITESFVFSLQLGDGDIRFVDRKGSRPILKEDKILGVETHSLSKYDSWKKAHTGVISLTNSVDTPFMFTLSTDGWINSHASEEEFVKTCVDYLDVINKNGTDVVEQHLEGWFSETSEKGCGDDITVVFVYYDNKE